jgi:hypothetical protein
MRSTRQYQRWKLAEARDALRQLPDGDDIDRIEGRIWTHLL